MQTVGAIAAVAIGLLVSLYYSPPSGNPLPLIGSLLQDGRVASFAERHEWADVVRLVASGSASVDSRDGWGKTALYYAAKQGHAGWIGALLALGADVELASVQGSTPLMVAAAEGRTAAVVELLRAGARVDRANGDGKTAIDFAQGRVRLLEVLLAAQNEQEQQRPRADLIEQQTAADGRWAQLALTSSRPQQRVRVMTFNVRYGGDKDNSTVAWRLRRDRVGALLWAHGADVVALQEVLVNQLEDIVQLLGPLGYKAVGVGRDDGERKGEYVPILVDTTKWAIDSNETFWLSKTPSVPGSKSWDSSIPRIATLVRLTSTTDPSRKLVVINTHLDHEGAASRRMAALLLLQHVQDEQQAGSTVLLVGDFNDGPSSPTYADLLAQGRLVDAFNASIALPVGPAATFPGFFNQVRDAERIDHVLFAPGTAVPLLATVLAIDADTQLSLPSDHRPVLVDFLFSMMRIDAQSSAG